MTSIVQTADPLGRAPRCLGEPVRGDDDVPLRKGDALLVPRDVEHGLANRSADPLRIMLVFGYLGSRRRTLELEPVTVRWQPNGAALDFSRKVVLVTGASSGIGAADALSAHVIGQVIEVNGGMLSP